MNNAEAIATAREVLAAVAREEEARAQFDAERTLANRNEWVQAIEWRKTLCLIGGPDLAQAVTREEGEEAPE